jgi:hypothetical protein
MTGDVCIPSVVNDKNLEHLLESVSFPLTKDEIIQKAEAKRVPPYLIGLFRNLPSRFYQSKNELIGQCVIRSMGYSAIGFNARLDYQIKV